MQPTYIRLKNGEVWVLVESYDDYVMAYQETYERWPMTMQDCREIYYYEILTMDTDRSKI
jgi:hypothetical protein